jgi:hypothetical protein
MSECSGKRKPYTLFINGPQISGAEALKANLGVIKEVETLQTK